MIKSIFIYASLGCICLFSTQSCGKRPEGFDMTYRRTFQLLSGLGVSASHRFEFKNIAADTAVFFKTGGSTRELIQKIYPSSMNIRALFANDAQALNIMYSVDVQIFDPNRPNLGEPTIFYRDQVPINTGFQLDLVPNNVDLRPFLFDSKTFGIKVIIRVNELTSRTTDLEWNATFLACQASCE
jgi:hypothetical protein